MPILDQRCECVTVGTVLIDTWQGRYQRELSPLSIGEPCFLPFFPSSVQLRAGRNVGIDHQEMELFFLPFLVDGAEEHTAGFDAHHGSRRKIRDGDAGLSDQLFRLIKGVNTA